MSGEANDMIDVGGWGVPRLDFKKPKSKSRKATTSSKPSKPTSRSGPESTQNPKAEKKSQPAKPKPAAKRTARPSPSAAKSRPSTQSPKAKPARQSKKLLNRRIDIEVIEALRSWSATSGLRYDSALFHALDTHGDAVVKKLAAQQKALAEFDLAPARRTARVEQLGIRVNPNLEAKFLAAVESAGVSQAVMLQAVLRAFLEDHDLL